MSYLLSIVSFSVLSIFCYTRVSGLTNNELIVTKSKLAVRFNQSDISLEIHETKLNDLYLLNHVYSKDDDNQMLLVYITYQIDASHQIETNESSIGKYIVNPISNISLNPNNTDYYEFNITAKNIGSVYLGISSNDIRFEEDKYVYCHVQVVHSRALSVICDIIGWLYFIAWTVSFYPQIILNIKRNSVVGLNFDFVIYNWIGFFAYSVFNVGLFWVVPLKNLYKSLHPIGVIPVQLNDVIFSLHALFIVTVLLVQCCIYERGGQTVPKFCWCLAGCMIVYMIVVASVAATGRVRTFTWLDFIYYLSYLKLFVTLIKYIPQAFMNFRKKSTDGWSIWGVLLDLIGGTLSIMQMIMLSYNNDDWPGFVADPTKLGLGLFSIMFDFLFIVQHYILYRKPSPILYTVIDEDTDI